MNKWKLERKDNGGMIELPPSLFWSDEFAWSDLAQSSPKYTVGGSVVIQQGVKLAGRPITLEIDKHELLGRGEYETLQEWTAVKDLQMTLTHLDGRTFNVGFRTHEKAIECEPVFHEIPQEKTDKYTGKINLITL